MGDQIEWIMEKVYEKTEDETLSKEWKAGWLAGVIEALDYLNAIGHDMQVEAEATIWRVKKEEQKLWDEK